MLNNDRATTAPKSGAADVLDFESNFSKVLAKRNVLTKIKVLAIALGIGTYIVVVHVRCKFFDTCPDIYSSFLGTAEEFPTSKKIDPSLDPNRGDFILEDTMLTITNSTDAYTSTHR